MYWCMNCAAFYPQNIKKSEVKQVEHGVEVEHGHKNRNIMIKL